MDDLQAIAAFSALAQGTRLEAFRLLVEAEPAGIAAGDIARLVGVPQNTMSAHLAVLSRANLISAQRRSRSIVYRADLEAMHRLTGFLVNDCCCGRPELCQPPIDDLTPCCSPKERADA